VEVDRNPIVLLDKLPVERLEELSTDNGFLEKMDAVYAQLKETMSEQP